MEGFVNNGDPITYTSYTSTYVHATSIMQNLYNRPNQFTPGWAAMDVLHVSRSIVWLSPDYIVVYDRCVCASRSISLSSTQTRSNPVELRTHYVGRISTETSISLSVGVCVRVCVRARHQHHAESL